MRCALVSHRKSLVNATWISDFSPLAPLFPSRSLALSSPDQGSSLGLFILAAREEHDRVAMQGAASAPPPPPPPTWPAPPLTVGAGRSRRSFGSRCQQSRLSSNLRPHFDQNQHDQSLSLSAADARGVARVSMALEWASEREIHE